MFHLLLAEGLILTNSDFIFPEALFLNCRMSKSSAKLYLTLELEDLTTGTKEAVRCLPECEVLILMF